MEDTDHGPFALTPTLCGYHLELKKPHSWICMAPVALGRRNFMKLKIEGPSIDLRLKIRDEE